MREIKKITVNAWGKLFNKRFLDDIQFPEGRIHEDQAIIPILLSKAKSVAVCFESLYGYRIRKDSIMQSRFTLKRYDDIVGVDECLAYFKQQGDEELMEAASKRRAELIAHYSLLARKAGIYKDLPAEYKMSWIKAVRYLRANLPYDAYSFRMVKIYPIFIIGAYIRKLKSLWPLKDRKR